MTFEEKVAQYTGGGLRCREIETLQVNLGLKCNQRCAHCHVSASPGRLERMERHTMELVVKAAKAARPGLVDVTGGAPELNPGFTYFVAAMRDAGLEVQVRTNLTALIEAGRPDLPGFLAGHGVALAASMPCYLEENVRAQRGPGVYEKSIVALRRLNEAGYGVADGLRLDLVYNPGGAYLPPAQASLEADYRRELFGRFGIRFSNLVAIANMPIGRFRSAMSEGGDGRGYAALLAESFNPDTLDGLMCRRQVSVGWDGTLYDCDFNLALGLPVEDGVPRDVAGFDPARLAGRRVITGEHCFGCTAGCGSSCRGALV